MVAKGQERSAWMESAGRHRRQTNSRDQILINAENIFSYSDLTLNQVLSFYTLAPVRGRAARISGYMHVVSAFTSLANGEGRVPL